MHRRLAATLFILMGFGGCYRWGDPPETPERQVGDERAASAPSVSEESTWSFSLLETRRAHLAERVAFTAEVECHPSVHSGRLPSWGDREGCPEWMPTDVERQPRPCSGVPVRGSISRADSGTFRMRYPRECSQGPVSVSLRFVGNPLRADFSAILCLDSLVLPSHPSVDCGIATFWGAALVERIAADEDECEPIEVQAEPFRNADGRAAPVLYRTWTCRGQRLYRCFPFEETCRRVENVEETLVAVGL